MNTVIICDDNRPFCDLLEKLLNKYAESYDIQIVKFYDGNSLMEYCGNNPFDIAYLDIEIGEENGLDIAKKLKYFNPKAIMIYISSHENYYMDMLAAEPFRFIKKDLLDIEKFERELGNTLIDAIKRIKYKNTYVFEFGKNKYMIELDKIQYFYSETRTIHICGNVGDAPFYFYGKIDELQKELQNNDNFVRISKSYIVNLKYVLAVGKNYVKIGSKELTLSSKYKLDFESKYYTIGSR